MINIKTEFSFRKVYGHIEKVVARCAEIGYKVAVIADMDNTFGHVQWRKYCNQYKIKPCYGVSLRVYESDVRERKVDHCWFVFVAKNDKGLTEVYDLVATAYSEGHYYYNPRLFKSDIKDASNDILCLPPNYILSPNNLYPMKNASIWAGMDNNYLTINDRQVYELMAEQIELKTTPQHILSKNEWVALFPKHKAKWSKTEKTLLSYTADLKNATMVKYKGKFNLESLCKIGAELRGIDMEDPVYLKRYEYELKLIREKDFDDYFLVVADLVNYSKEHMLVGPSRGSSAGSLVCYLLGITEVDPIPHGLIFERFIDITRLDLPDIDIDFPDNKRAMSIEYLKNQYGVANVAHLGTVSRLKAKSAIGEFSKALGIPAWESKKVKDAIIERPGGDARAAMCISDTLETTEAGKEFIKKYPMMAMVEKIESHARHSGVHAAGIIVCNEPVTTYAGVDTRNGVAMLDKKDAEAINLLKIDVLGLRTLTVLEQTLEQIGKGFNWLYRLPLDDKKTFAVFNSMQLTGIFQFEGYALRSLTRQMVVEEFNDIVAITSLARPGPLHSGGATDFIERRTGRKKVKYLHESIKPYTEETYGAIVYQEQVMNIVKNVGGFNWADTATIRKCMSKTLGDEFFNKYKIKFVEGCGEKGITPTDAAMIWNKIMTFGSWAFNKSHAVSYGLISYWTAYLKAYWPLEFAVAALNNVKDDAHGVKLLRDLVKNEDVTYEPINAELSQLNWSVQDGVLIGGLTNIKGIGLKKAQQILDRRKEGKKQTPSIMKMLDNPITPYADLFPVETRYGDYYTHPEKYNITTQKLSYLKDVQANGVYIFIGKLVDRNLRDLNEYGSLVKRDGKIIKCNNLFLNLTVEDDTDSIICTIDRFKYEKMGKTIAASGKVGEDFYLIKGILKSDWRKIYVQKIKLLSV